MAAGFINRAVETVRRRMTTRMPMADFVKYVENPTVFSKNARAWLKVDEYIQSHSEEPWIYKDDFLAHLEANIPDIEEVEVNPTRYGQFALPGSHRYGEKLYRYNKKDGGPTFSDDEWGGFKSILMHVRHSDFETRDGRAVFVLEEVQSIWHQKGRRHPDIPKAPYEKTWHEYLMKKMLAYAADRGYDFLAWPTGQHHVDRYDLVARGISAVDYMDAGDGKCFVRIWLSHGGTLDMRGVLTQAARRRAAEHGEEWNQQRAANIIRQFRYDADLDMYETPDHLMEELVGVTLTDHMVANKVPGEVKTIDSEMLRHASDNLKKFYDLDADAPSAQNIARFMNSYVKPHGSGVRKIMLSIGEEVWGVELTPALKQWLDTTPQELKESAEARDWVDPTLQFLSGHPTFSGRWDVRGGGPGEVRFVRSGLPERWNQMSARDRRAAARDLEFEVEDRVSGLVSVTVNEEPYGPGTVWVTVSQR